MTSHFRIVVPRPAVAFGIYEPGFEEIETFTVDSPASLVIALQERTPKWPPGAVLVPADEGAVTMVLRASVERGLRVAPTPEERIQKGKVGFTAAEVGLGGMDCWAEER